VSLTMIVIAKLKAAFPDRPFHFAGNNQPFASLLPEWDDFGAIELVDDGGELMVNFGSFTHTHIVGANHEEIAEQVVQLLKDTFADRLLFWAIGQHGSGGAELNGEEPFWGEDERLESLRRGVWSGPLHDRGCARYLRKTNTTNHQARVAAMGEEALKQTAKVAVSKNAV
jgi:hypothetical protein